MSQSLADLLPQVRAKANEFLDECSRQGINLRVVFTFRSHDEQQKLYEQGRTLPGHVVTNAPAYKSWHEFRRAFDVCPQDDKGNLDWNAPEEVWEKMGAIGEALGLEWGGHWTHIIDRPHFQFTEGLSLMAAALCEKHDSQADGDKA